MIKMPQNVTFRLQSGNIQEHLHGEHEHLFDAAQYKHFSHFGFHESYSKYKMPTVYD